MQVIRVMSGAAVAASVVLAPSRASADVIPISVGARVGYAKFLESGSDTSYLPLQLDAMYSLGFGLRVGVYGSYGPALSKGDGVSSSSLLRAGIQAHFRLPLPLVHPWVGAGTGYERVSSQYTQAGAGFTSVSSGWERFNLQAGVQFSVLPLFELGPYVQYENGKYSSSSVDVTSTSDAQGTTVGTSNKDDGHGRINVGLRAELSF